MKLAASIAIAIWLAATSPQAQRTPPLAELYPVDEHCIFVPPPVWRDVNPEQRPLHES